MSPSHPAHRLRFAFETEAVDPRPLDRALGVQAPATSPPLEQRPAIVDLNEYRVTRWLRTFECFARDLRTRKAQPAAASPPAGPAKDG